METSSLQRVYRIKLELDFAVMVDVGKKVTKRHLGISLKESERCLENILNPLIAKHLADEFEFFSNDEFAKALREFARQLTKEITFKFTNNRSQRERFIADSIGEFKKGIRKRVKAARGRPKDCDLSDFEWYDSIEIDLFVANVLNCIRELISTGKKTTKSAVACCMFPRASNPLRDFDAKLRKYRFTFQQFIGLESPLMHIRDWAADQD